MNRNNNWGYPTEASSARSSKRTALAPEEATPEVFSSKNQRRRLLFHLKIILLSAICVSTVRVLIAFVDSGDFDALIGDLASLFTAEKSIIAPVKPLLAAVPELEQPNKAVWKCDRNFTNNPLAVDNCEEFSSQHREDPNGNKYFTGPWNQELEDEYYR